MENKQILRKLLRPTYDRDHHEWQDYINTDNASILWYPSAGDDFRLFVHLGQGNLLHIFDKTPVVIYSSIDEYPCFFNNEPFTVQDLEINITLRIPLMFNFMPPEYVAEENDSSSPIAPKNEAVSSSGIHSILKPKTIEEIEKNLKERNMNWTDIETHQDHNIYLFKIDITGPHNVIRNQYVLYFFCDNIQFFELLLNEQKLPVECILSKRDRMDDEIKYRQFWQLFNTNQTVRHLICDNAIFGNLDKIGDELVQVALQGNVLAQLQFLGDIQWDAIDMVSSFQVVE